MLEDEADELGIFDAGHHAECSAAALTGLDVDAKGALEALHPAHGVRLRRRRMCGAAAPCRSDRRAPVAVRGAEALKARQVHARQRHEGGKACQEVERLAEHVCGAVTIGGLERVTNPPTCRLRQALGGERRAADVATRPLHRVQRRGRGPRRG